MADGNSSPTPSSASLHQHHREAIKSSVHNTAASQRREQAIAIGKERREAFIRAKRVCRAPLSGSDEAAMEEGDMVIDEEKAGLEARTAQAVEELKFAVVDSYWGRHYTRRAVVRQEAQQGAVAALDTATATNVGWATV